MNAKQHSHSPRYISVAEAVERTLKDLGGSSTINELLKELWKRYVGGKGEERVVMRIYLSPPGKLWSPEAEEALGVLESAGVIERKNGKVFLKLGSPITHRAS